MTKQVKVQQLELLTKWALADPAINTDVELVTLLREIQVAAVKGQLFYDDRQQFQPLVSRYTRQHQMRTPTVLTKLLALVRTPRAWSGL